MSSLLLLGASMALPWAACLALRPSWAAEAPLPAAVRDRRLGRFRRNALWVGTVAVVGSAVAGALLVDPALATEWPTAGSWFFASLCAVTAWASLALGTRTPEDARAMPALQMIGRTVQIAFVPIVATALSLISKAGMDALLPGAPMTRALCAALLSVAAVLVVSPSLAMLLGVWRVLPRRFDAQGVSWRLVHLPVPSPFFVHAAALPLLRVVLVSDGLLNHAPVEHWRALVDYEASGAAGSPMDRAMRWALAIPLSISAFVVAFAVGAAGPRELVAATVLAVFFTSVSSWLANRVPASQLALGANGPSMRELAQSLRSLPPPHRQALPRTSRSPLSTIVYDRLFALGHDPGPRPQA